MTTLLGLDDLTSQKIAANILADPALERPARAYARCTHRNPGFGYAASFAAAESFGDFLRELASMHGYTDAESDEHRECWTLIACHVLDSCH